MRCPGANDRRIVDVEFGDSTNDGALHHQIGSDACGVAALGARGAGGGFRGTVVSRKLPKVNENPVAACIWMLTLVEKKMPDLDAIKLAVRTPEKSPLPGAPTVGLLIRQVHQGYAWR